MTWLAKRLSNQFIPFQVLFAFVIISSSDSTANASFAMRKKVGEKGIEAMALLTWKTSIDNQSQSLLSSWNESSHCSWVGIGCNEAGRVIYIDIKSYGLRGTLSELNFSSFPHLLSLELYNNSVYGTIPSQIGSLMRLTYLSLSNNHLSGTIPSEIGMLGSLTELFLYSNNLSGPIPPSIGNLGNLIELCLSNNQLSGPIP
ncbi:hypothetical protein ACSBR2_001079 [Camellia fascicularis]